MKTNGKKREEKKEEVTEVKAADCLAGLLELLMPQTMLPNWAKMRRLTACCRSFLMPALNS